ncbi:MAG: hypothetical protein KIT83_14085 [Bryobacterales bacterium]|nr:hypothetical protein [Bryobacterales bacterium]
MAEYAVVKEQLTNEMIEAGASLTMKLDELELPIAAAFWLFLPDLNEWRLMFASTAVSEAGPRSVYEMIRKALDQLGVEATLPLSLIGLLDADADLPRLLKAAMQTGPGVSRIRFSRNVVGGHFIDDALIYRAA